MLQAPVVIIYTNWINLRILKKYMCLNLCSQPPVSVSPELQDDQDVQDVQDVKVQVNIKHTYAAVM